MIVGGLIGLAIFSAGYLGIGLLIARIANPNFTRGVTPMRDEDEIDFRYYGDHYGEGGH